VFNLTDAALHDCRSKTERTSGRFAATGQLPDDAGTPQEYR